MSEQDTVLKEFEELHKAVGEFQQAILKFRGVFEPQTVGLDYWSESLDDTMFEISEDITSYFEEA